MPKFKDIVLGLADRVVIAEDVNTGERKVTYNVIKHFSGKSKVRDIYRWFDLSSYKRLAVVAPEGVYKDAQSLRGTFSFELWKGTASYNYMTAYAKYGIIYLEKLGGKAE